MSEILFGGSEDPTVTQASTLTTGQRELLDKLTGLISGQVGQGVSAYPGTTTAPASDIQSQVFTLVNNLLSGENSQAKQASTALESLMEPWDEEQATKQWKTGVEAPTMLNWEQNIAPDIMEQFAAYDAAGSGGAQKTLAKSATDLSTNLGASLSDFLTTSKQNAATNTLSASNLTMQNILQQLGLGTTVGGVERGIESEGLQEEYQKWLQSQAYANPWLSYLGSSLGTKAFENVASGGGYQSGIFGDLLGAGAKLGSAFILA